MTVRASPSTVFVAPGKSRTVTLTLEPDFCARTPVSLSLAGSAATLGAIGGAIPTTATGTTATGKVDLTHPSISVEIKGGSPGSTSLAVSITLPSGNVNATVPVEVVDPAIPSCTGTVSGKVTAGGRVGGDTAVLGASVGLQANADKPAQATEQGFTYDTPVVWAQQPFDASVSCASAGIVPSGYAALGPAITFGPETSVFPREVPLAIPINGSAFPDKGRLRHLRVAYSGPAFKAPRTVPIADPKIEKTDGGWVLKFLAPRLGTYQAVVAPDAGTQTKKRRITHRAVMGVSMGGGGTAIFGTRHHDKFDALGPLGGPVDWTWMMDHIEHNHTGGFPTNDGDTVPGPALALPKPKYPYEHPSTFNRWWYEYPRNGNGGGFAREEYSQIFRDLALMFGNPNGENKEPNGENLPAGVDPNGKSVVGEHPGRECAVFLDPIDGDPDKAKQQELQATCPQERCKNTQVLKNYYDRDFNPKGKWPVITVCDGAPQDKKKSPYANTWSKDGNDKPLELALAVDYNGNGVRDENEPIVRQGHEPWQDTGPDGLPSEKEPGYQKGVNEDPAGDDYDPQYNPTGTEGNGHYEQGEPFEDVGLDGVPNTKSSPYDFGEGDGKFTTSTGLARFWEEDTRQTLRQQATPPGGPIDDAAISRLDVWTDGGVRDLFNFGVDAQHLTGSLAARGRDSVYYTDFSHLPGQKPGDVGSFLPQATIWEDLPGNVMLRYGAMDPTPQDLIDGSGQHVGSVPELAARLRSALYFIGRRWPDAPRTFVEESATDPADGVETCVLKGNCTFPFTDSRGRVGPVTVTLPPGYASKTQQGVRYPVIYLLHGYGQTPEDLGAAIIFLRNWMNSGLDASATRLPKAIVVYVDGRCRKGPSGESECIRGTFYVDSPRANGAKQESWFLELMSHVDSKYRTMPETTIDWQD